DDRVVLAREQRVHGREADPPVAVDGGVFLLGIAVARVRIKRQMPGGVEIELAVRQQPDGPAAHAALHLEIGAVHLRPVPPLGGGVAEGGGRPSSAGPRWPSGQVRRTVISGFGQSSPGGTGIRIGGLVLSLTPWLSQSWTMNCSQAASSRVAGFGGMNLSRARGSRVVTRGVGS